MTASRAALAILACWLTFYLWRSMAGHLGLATNAFDLSMLDYSLWNSLHGRPGFVPFIGHSIFSHHFTPILWLLLPVYALAPSPVLLIVLQLLALAWAGWLFVRLTRRSGLDTIVALALLGVLLFSRRTHSATTSFFYPECFQAALTLLAIEYWPAKGWRYWAAAVLWLTTKEDAAIYLAAFALWQALRDPGRRPRAIQTIAAGGIWFSVGMLVIVPMSRVRDGLPARNSLLDARYSSEAGAIDAGSLASRSFSAGSATHVGNLLVTTGLLPVLGAGWLVPAIPGVLADVAARPENPQAGMIGHYFWPILPWIFLATATGALVVERRSRRVARVWALALLAATLVDTPALRGAVLHPADPRAAIVRAQLAAVTFGPDDVVLAQANLIPHLPHSNRLFAIGGEEPPPALPTLVLATPVGNLWPETPAGVDAFIAQYSNDRRYTTIVSGPLFGFRLGN